MTTATVLLILLSIVIAGGLSFFQYLYKANNKSNLYLLLAFLRFSILFGVLVLLINPIISTKKLEISKPPLPIVVDNSSSIVALNATNKTLELYKKIISNKAIQNKYKVQSFQFDNQSTNFQFSKHNFIFRPLTTWFKYSNPNHWKSDFRFKKIRKKESNKNKLNTLNHKLLHYHPRQITLHNYLHHLLTGLENATLRRSMYISPLDPQG